MLPAHLCTPVFYHTMLVVVFACALLYWAAPAQAGGISLFNQVAMIGIGGGVLLLIGFRPVSTIFVDMPNYAWDYERVQRGIEANYTDGFFNVLMRVCSPILPVEGFFFVCAILYIVPLAWASWRVHGAWAFPVFLASLSALSFWGYGVNGVRNGMATSILILAFAFHDKPLVMLAVMAAACGIHGSVIVPAFAFLVVRYVKRTELWLGFWALCTAASLLAGNAGERLLNIYNPVSWDARAEGYIHSAGSGFRADFLAYSIFPVLITLLLAAPTRARSRRLLARALNALGTGRGGMAGLPGARRSASLAFAGAGAGVAVRAPQRSSKPARPVSRVPTQARPSAGQGASAWDRLPWVRLLRSDPLYARLVNTYLITNALWVLVINTAFSNRFAYLSWFMMPWILLYPFVPGRIIDRPRTGLIGATLVAQYMFTYLMVVVVYPLRGLSL